MEILRQLGELFLEAVPTVVIIFLFYLLLRWSFFGPMERVLAERRARTEGARHAAEEAQAATKERLHAYQGSVQKARNEIYAEQDAARRAVVDERVSLIRTTRGRATDTIRAAKDRINADLAAARATLGTESQALADEIARAILEPRPPARPGASEAR